MHKNTNPVHCHCCKARAEARHGNRLLCTVHLMGAMIREEKILRGLVVAEEALAA